MSYEWSPWKLVPSSENAFVLPTPPAASIKAKIEEKNDDGSERRQINPYVYWATAGPGEDDIREDKEPSLLKLLPENASDDVPAQFKSFRGLLDRLPIPTFAAPPFSGDAREKLPLPPEDKLPIADGLEVIAGVIDVGIPLGHRGTRFTNGKTRILAAWQMLGNYDVNGSAPFGRELYRDEIDNYLKQHSGGAQNGWLDETAFNKATSGVILEENGGPRDLATRVSHGAHVLDAMAGDNLSDDEARAKVGIIAINAPSAATFGANGTYLEQFLFHGIKRIVEIADATWLKNNPDAKAGDQKGYPIVINMAFGKQSGSKDIFDVFALALALFNEFRETNNLSKVHFVMPTGNDNLTQSNAFLEPEKGDTLSLDWRILPEDQSSNFVELWATDTQGADEIISVVPSLSHPQMSKKPLPLPKLKTARNLYFFSDLMQDGKILARVYMKRHVANVVTDQKMTGASDKRYRVQFIFCVAPTYRHQSDGETRASGAPGLWTISVHNRGQEQKSCVLSIQTDQGLTPTRSINRRSYFEHENYEKYDEMGRLVDSYSYPPGKAGDVDNLDTAKDTPIRRHGTMLATASTSFVTRVGGYRASDGRPAFYSSTGRGRTKGEDDGTKLGFERGKNRTSAPTAALPTEDVPSLFGILSAGSTDGSRIGMRGTSFATPQASRLIIEFLLSNLRSNSHGNAIISSLASSSEARETKRQFSKRPNELIEVLGAGRIPAPYKGNYDRLS